MVQDTPMSTLRNKDRPEEPHIVQYVREKFYSFRNTHRYTPPSTECELCGSYKETSICVRTITRN